MTSKIERESSIGKPFLKAIGKMAKNRCFICNERFSKTKISMWTETEDKKDTISCDVPCCIECKQRIERE